MKQQQGIPARRAALQSLQIGKETHAGLALQRYLEAHKPKARDNQQTMPEESLLDSVANVRASEVYLRAWQRWEALAQTKPSDRARAYFTLTAAAPIAIGLGNASPLEVGLTLHHTYGMPVIPGSALKGLCRRGARLLMHENKIDLEAVDYMFGTGGDVSAAVGAVVFYDAWYDPRSVGGAPFHRDVITVHHPQYYSSGGAKFPTDFDDPNPVPFLVIKPGAQFLFVLDAPTVEWAHFAEKLLRWCLCNLGVGAKTNAGYGYFDPKESSQASPPSAAFQTEQEVWRSAHITWNPGKQEIQATNPQNPQQRAAVQGAEAQKLLSGLPDAAVQRFKEVKRLKADVQVQRLGNMIKIVRIIPAE